MSKQHQSFMACTAIKRKYEELAQLSYALTKQTSESDKKEIEKEIKAITHKISKLNKLV